MEGTVAHHDGVIDLLASSGFDSTKQFRLVRHAGGHVPDVYPRGLIETYQMFQVRQVFHGLDCIISFVGLPDNAALLLGVYDVVRIRSGDEGRARPGCPKEEWTRGDYFYELKKASGFEKHEGNVVIDWGPGARSWVQLPKYKRVLKPAP